MSPETVVYESLGVRIDTAAYRAELNGRVLSLEPKAFDLLVLLVTRAGQLVTKQEILDVVWAGTAVTDNALTRVVAQLRKALGDDAREAKYLETVPTRGYRWLAPVTRRQPAFPVTPGQAGVGPRPDQDPNVVRTRSEPADGATQPIESARGKRWVRVGIGFCVLAFVAGAWMVVDRMARRHPPSLFPQQATLSTGLDVYPALSPDGERLAYSSDRTGSWEIYIKPADSAASEIALTSDGNNNLHAAWSPDGRLIAFHSIRRGGIWTVPIEGGPPRQVSAFGSKPTWAPDSRRLAFQSEPAADIGPNARAANLPSTIWTVDTHGGQPRPLTRRGIPVGGHGAPAWSPDGRHIAFATADFAISQIWAVDAEGGEPHLISEPRGLAYDPAYLPDGRGLIFGSGPTLWRAALNSEGRRVGGLTPYTATTLDNLRHFSIARDGRIAVAALTLQTALWSVNVDRDGQPTSEPQALTNDTRPRNSVPAFSPDGGRIALMSSIKGQLPNIWLVRSDGSDLRQLTTVPTIEIMPNWIDGQHLTFKSIRDGRAGLWQVNVETRQEKRLVDFGSLDEILQKQGFMQEAKISPDGTRIAFGVLDPRTATKALYVRTIEDGREVRVTSGDPPASFPAWSPDGRWIACELQSEGGAITAVVPSSGGTPQPLTKERGHSWVHSWSPDSTRVLFAGQRNGVWNIYWVPRAGGPEQRVTTHDSVRTFVRYPSWSPRGDQIVYEFGEVRGNVWLLSLR